MEKTTPRGKVAVITGAGSGIGNAIALRLAQEGIDLVLCGRNPEKLQKSENQVQKYGVRTLVLPGDLAEDDYLFSFLDRAAEHFGGVDILINNAGMALSRRLEDTTPDEFDRIVRLNLRSSYFACQSALKWLKQSDWATIINISSNMGHSAYPDQSAYVASKHGVHGFTKSLAKEVYQDGIRCHLISPGGVFTDMVKISRPDLSAEGMIAAEEVAEAAAFFICHRGNAVLDEIQVHRVGKEPFS
ncbi:MAG: SDR family NAD(P)-dependent oxidoreductase [Spirochaetales bacterium]|nr:SDR family NAD(P)-dependent oxidoreductase [Spirochaetales bacterium]